MTEAQPGPADALAGGGAAVLLPYQRRWVADESEVKICAKSRRIGLTWAEASDDVLIASVATGGDDVFYIGYNLEMAREFIDACAMWARAFGRAAEDAEEFLFADQDERSGETRHIQAFRITFASGHKIAALSSRPRSLRGMQGVIVIDEAAFHDDLEELLKAAMAMLIWGSKVRIISTHDGADNPFNQLIQDCRAGRRPYTVHQTDFDQALDDGLFRRICEVTGRAWSPEAQADWRAKIVAMYRPNEDEELFCIPRQGGGVYLPGALVEGCMEDGIPVLRWQCRPDFAQLPDEVRELACESWMADELVPLLERLDPDCLSYFGEDFGRSGDLTVFFPLQVMRDLVRRCPFIVELSNVPFTEQERILYRVADALPRFAVGALDARGNGQFLAERAMQRYGSGRIEQVMLSAEWYRDNMPKYKAAFEDRTIVLPRDNEILNDHRAVRMEKGIARVPEGLRSRGRGGTQRHGDAAIAGALAYYATTRDVADYGYRTPARARPFDESGDRDLVEDQPRRRGFAGISGGFCR